MPTLDLELICFYQPLLLFQSMSFYKGPYRKKVSIFNLSNASSFKTMNKDN